jgi:hypothetical protein
LPFYSGEHKRCTAAESTDRGLAVLIQSVIVAQSHLIFWHYPELHTGAPVPTPTFNRERRVAIRITINCSESNIGIEPKIAQVA